MSKICLITGASRGIGAAIFEAIRQTGHHPIALVRKPETVDGEAYPVDVTDRGSIQRAVEQIMAKHGQIDVLVNNAGFGVIGPVELVSDEEMQRQFDVNVFGLLRMTQEVLPHMRKAQSGLIINISSIAGVYTGLGSGLYAATKHAVESLTVSMASQLASWNIRAVSVNPGWVHTEFAESAYMGSRLKEQPYQAQIDLWKEYAKEGIARGQDPAEVGALVVELIASPDPDILNATTERGREGIARVLVDPTGKTPVQGNLAQLAQSPR